ncbi:uncharacterized protein [Palaemon carinicauda]|uniref:uncharacterized protein n=1 Tax=Palaemon carinicauda TaxID=392227 RepID=UPI0035B661DF
MPLLRGCCFCYDLKVGSKIIGILSLVGALLNSLTLAGTLVIFVFLGLGADAVNTLSKHLEKAANDYEDEYVDVREDQPPTIMELFLAHITSVTIVLYVLLALCIFMIITSSMLIHGVKNDRRGLLLPFIGQEAVNAIVFLSLFIWILATFGTDTKVIGMAISILLGTLVRGYFALVVFSQYQALGLIRMHEEHSMK